MITLEAHYIYLLIVSNAILLALACTTLERFERRCRRMDEFWASPTGTALADDRSKGDSKQMHVAQQLEQRVGELQRTLKLIQSNNAEPPLPPTERNLPIENAVRMARLGASIDDLTRNCGLNVGEARLMKKLHGQAQLQATGKG